MDKESSKSHNLENIHTFFLWEHFFKDDNWDHLVFLALHVPIFI